MNDQQISELKRIVEDVEEYIETLAPGHAFLETENEDGELGIYGNREGLVRLARFALSLASKGVPGSHYNFDEASELHDCAQAFIIGFKPAEWDT